MPRRRKATEQPVTDTTSETQVTTAQPISPDVADLAEHHAAQTVQERAHQEREKPIDPRRQASVSLTEDANHGPKAVLWRNNAGQELAITFDEKPEPQHLQTLKDAGLRWQNDAKAWTKPMDPDRKWATHLDVERVFYKVSNDIRQERGLEPVQGVNV